MDARGGRPPLRVLAYTGTTTSAHLWTPRIELVVGRDEYSGGMTLVSSVQGPASLHYNQQLIAKRWRNSPQSVQECLEIAYKGIKWYADEAEMTFS